MASIGAPLQPTNLVWRETEYVIPSSAKYITVSGGGADASQGTLFSFTLQSTGGAAWTQQQDSAAPCISWQIENGSAGKLTLVEHNPGSDVPAVRLVLQFATQLYPGAVVVPGSHGKCGVVGITAHGAMFCVDLDTEHGGLGDVKEQHVRLVDISSQWSSLGSPTCLSCTKEHVAVGGSQGPVLCLPIATLLDAAASHHMTAELAGGAAPAAGKAFILRESSWGIKSLMAGVWQRPRSPAATSIMHQPMIPGSPDKAGQLLVIYDDGTLRGFSLARQTQLFSDTLACCTQGRRATPIFAALSPSRSPAAHAIMVVQVEASDTLSKLVYLMQLAFPTPGSKPTVRQQLQCTADPADTLVAMHATDAAAWLLYRGGDGSSHLVRYSLTGNGQPAGAAVLLEHGLLLAGNAQQQGGMDPMSAGLWEEVLRAADDSGSVSETQALCRLLAPGALYRDALCTALRYHGIALTADEVASSSRAALHTRVLAAVERIQTRNAALSRARCWAQLLASYQDAWSKMHPLLGLVALPGQPHPVATLRGGGVQGVLRGTALPEALGYADPIQAATLVSGPSTQALLELPAAIATVQQAAQQLSGLLGAWAQDAASVLLAQGVGALDCLVPCLMKRLLEGVPPAALGSLDDNAKAQASAWRQRKQHTLLTVAASLATLPELMIAIRTYCEMLALASPPSASMQEASIPDGRQPDPASLSLFLAQSAHQMCTAQAQQCLDALLLLCMVRGQRLPGGPPLNAKAQAALSNHLVPQLDQLCRRAALVVWLTSTASTTSHAWPTSDFSLTGLAALAIGSPVAAHRNPASPTAAAPTTHSRPQQCEVSLATRLIPKHLVQEALARASTEGLLSGAAGQAFASLLQHGTASDTSSSPMALEPAGGALPVQEQLLQLGYQLFVALEHAALAGIAQLARAGRGQDGCTGIQLLEGLSVACTLRGVEAGLREQAVAHASGCFFRAAAGLHAGSSPRLLRILHDLTQHMTGVAPPLGAESSTAMLQLQLYEAAMQVFELEGAPSGALAFARAALEHSKSAATLLPARATPPPHEDMETDDDGGAARVPNPSSGEARLWSNIFTYCCELRRWHDAYAALVSNPDTQQGLDCLWRLVHELSEAGQLDVLCSLPLAGALLLLPGPGQRDSSSGQGAGGDAQATLVTLRDETVAALKRRARNSELTVQPQPYSVLYTFLVSRHDYREAAAAMMAYAWRMRAEATRTHANIQETLLAYQLAIHCLSVVDVGEAWLDSHSPWLLNHMQTPGTQRPHTLFGSVGPSAPALPTHRCVTVEQLRRQQAVLRAAAQVHAAGAVPGLDPLSTQLDAFEVLRYLVRAGRFEDALTMANTAWVPGSRGNQDALEQVVAALAETAATMQFKGGCGTELPAPLSLLSRDPQEQQQLLGCTHMLSPAAPYWNKLRALLERYMQHDTAGGEGAPGAVAAPCVLGDVLRVAAADAVLRTDRHMGLPVWMLQLFTEPNGANDSCQHGMAVSGCGPASLLDLYLRYDRLADGTALVAGSLAAWSRVDARNRQRHAATWFPHTRIKVLRQRLVSEVERGKPESASVLSELDEALAEHAELMTADAAATLRDEL